MSINRQVYNNNKKRVKKRRKTNSALDANAHPIIDNRRNSLWWFFIQ